MHEDGLQLGLGCFTSQSPWMLCITYITLCSDLSSQPFISHCKFLHSLQAGQTPVVLASGNGHSDVVGVLVGQYGCSMNDEEVSAVC